MAQIARDRQPDAGIFGEFVPIGDSNEPFVDGGHIVRVELPRTALVAFGMSAAEEPSADPLQAYVLFGADGRARGVRFVSSGPPSVGMTPR